MNAEPAPMSIPATWQLLLACARPLDTADAVQRLELLLRGQVDWQRLLDLSVRQGVMPRLCGLFNDRLRDVVPRPERERLHQLFRAHSVRTLGLTAELLRLLDDLNARGIRAIAFKGPTLAIQAYGDVCLRQFGDLDLLVQESELPSARAVLEAHGYQPLLYRTPIQEEFYLRAGGHLALMRHDRRIMVELHTQLAPRAFAFTPDLKAMQNRSVTLAVLGRSVPVFSPEDLLVFLCAHGGKHLWSNLGWICDVAALTRAQPGLDWPRIIGQARQTHSVLMLLLGLHLAHTLLAAPLPAALQTLIAREPRVPELAAEVCRKLFADEPYGATVWKECRFYLRARERVRDGLRYFLNTVLAPSMVELTRWPVPRAFIFVYYFIRPVRLALKYVRRL